jgi:para-nitrobenzyl esterase
MTGGAATPAERDREREVVLRGILTLASAGFAALLMTAPAWAARVDGGAIVGVRKGAIVTYAGVPYAAAAVGDLRWREPRPVRPWTGVRPARDFAPACMQSGVSMPGEPPSPVSEDCLYLNVWAPAAPGPPHPVMVFFPGGGFTNGSTSIPLYRGDQLASKGVVVVTVAYRLGPLGFLALPALTRESPQASSGNYGLLDQIAALRWVQRNIAALGGDPARVTIFGQSAGATSVSVLMASPLAKGLFQRAIGESGGLFEPLQLAPRFRLKQAEADGLAYAATLGATSLDALRRLPASRFAGPGAAAVSHAVIDPYVLPLSPADAFAQGRQNDVPLLVGSNQDEARSLIAVGDVRAATFAADIARQWGPLPPSILAAYPHGTDAQARQARLDFERDLRFGWDVWAWARLQAATGHSPAYLYRFTREPPFRPGSAQAGWGASHFADLWYVFDHLDPKTAAWTAADRDLAEVMTGYWIRFAATGDPNGSGRPRWPRFADPIGGPMLGLGTSISAGPVTDLAGLKAFDTAYSQLRGAPLPAPLAPDSQSSPARTRSSQTRSAGGGDSARAAS